ncbi:hypothetical protein DICVIV_10105 [Dictyocaulus viviparus]|uniref:Syntaxin-5 N-terminal Sly1p-binding domain-containing protein n=1 Tax=Dictyocaulus viviparus TaxID=29172 RepID=A0A0D8XH01_DICVI|nr:hypothetical protein DICVIV_10105 [Dictyocaulus viviparus]
MSNSSIRSRRRIDSDSKPSVPIFDDHDSKKDFASVPSSLFKSYPVFSGLPYATSPAQLWNSAQEALSSIRSPLVHNPEQQISDNFVDKEFPALSIFADPVDSITLTMPSRDRTAEFRTTCKSLQMKIQSNGFIPHTKKEILTESVQFNQLAKYDRRISF